MPSPSCPSNPEAGAMLESTVFTLPLRYYSDHMTRQQKKKCDYGIRGRLSQLSHHCLVYWSLMKAPKGLSSSRGAANHSTNPVPIGINRISVHGSDRLSPSMVMSYEAAAGCGGGMSFTVPSLQDSQRGAIRAGVLLH